MSSALYILSFLNEGDTAWLLQSGETESLPAGTVLIREGEPVQNNIQILDGELSISIDALGGKEVARRGRGQIVGEMSFIEVGRPAATVRVRDDATLFRIACATLAAKLRLDLGFASRFYHALAVLVSERLRDSQAGQLSQTRKLRDAMPDSQAGAGATALANVFLASGRLDRLLTRLSSDANLIVLTGNDLTIEQTLQVAYHHHQVAVSPFVREHLIAARRCVDRLTLRPDPIYGLTTGLGALKDQRVAPDRMDQYQRNVLMSHAVGVGPDFDEATVRAIMLARLNGMARGGSGIRPSVFDLLLAMLNAGIHPIVPGRGSIGMADLSPLAHLSLPLNRSEESRASGGVSCIQPTTI
jgi:CRP-like cAMP-binding protein